MNLLRHYRFASFMIVLIAIAAFAVAELDFTTLFVGVVVAMLSWYVTEGPRGRTLPNWASNLLVLALVSYSGFSFVTDGEIGGAMAALGQFLLWLLVIKLYARRTANEDRQRFTLATMLILVGCLESVQFVFGIMVFAYAAAAVWTAMLWRISLGADSARADRVRQGGFAPPIELAYGRRATPQFRGIATASVLATFAASVLVFFLFPRFSEVRLGDTGGGSGAVTGFSDQIDLRGGDRIVESRRELFTLQCVDMSGVAFRSPRPLLLRGAVLDTYDAEAQRWTSRRSVSGARTLRTPTDARLTDLARGNASDVRTRFLAKIQMRAMASDVIFSIYAPVAIATSESRTIAIEPSTLLLRDVSVDRIGRSWSYDLLVQPQPNAETLEDLAGGPRGFGDTAREAARSAARTRFPVEAVRPIAERIFADVARSSNIPPEPAADADQSARWLRNREVARAIASWMKSNFTYTTDLSAFGRIPGEDPIVSFLERYRSGHCEYFASGLCAVLRSLGIESRIVTGFMAMEYDEQGESYVVREANAHAWVEVRTSELGWTAVDPTPEESLFEIQERNRSFADRFRWIYGNLEFLWNSSVVTYDASAQATIADRLQTGWRATISERIESVLARMRALATSLSLGSAGGAWFAAIGIGVSTAGLAALIIVVRRRQLRRTLHLEHVPVREQHRLQREAAFYVEAVRALESAGARKPAHLSPRAFAEALSARNREVGAAFAAIADDFYRVRYGGISPSRDEARSHVSRVLALRALLRHNSASIRVD